MVALAATDCTTGATIARQQVDVERKEDVLRAMGTITADVREALGESRTSLARHNVPIEEATTPSLDALKAYTEGTAAAGRRPRDRGDPVLRARHRARLALRAGLHHAVEPLRRPRRDRPQRGTGAAGLRATAGTSASASGCSSPTSTTTASPAIRRKTRETLEVWKRTYPRDYRPANALAVLLNRLGDYDAAIAEARRSDPAATRRTRFRSRTWPMRCAAPAGSTEAQGGRGAGRGAATSAPVRCGGCCISSPRCRATSRRRSAQLEWAATEHASASI